DRPILDQLREDAERDAVLGVVERRHQDGSVRDVKVRITRGEALALEVERRRHRQIDHIDLGPVFESHPLKTLAVFLEWPVVRIVRVRLPAQYDRAGTDEATQIVHMAVGTVAPHSLAAPAARVGRSSRGCGRFHRRRAHARSRRTPTESERTYRANRWRCAATRATWRNATPTRRACGSRGRSGCRPLRMVVEEAAADP